MCTSHGKIRSMDLIWNYHEVFTSESLVFTEIEPFSHFANQFACSNNLNMKTNSDIINKQSLVYTEKKFFPTFLDGDCADITSFSDNSLLHPYDSIDVCSR
jgi:hypothetical protein